MRGIVSALLLLYLAGCGPVGPDYRRVDPPVPARFGSLEAGISTGEEPGDRFLGSWWKIFHDPVLESLIERAVAGNLDLRIARSRVEQARALMGISSSRLFPEGEFSGGVETYRRSDSTRAGNAAGGGAVPGASTGRRSDFYQAGFDASWEIDFFGGIRREIEAAEANLGASEEALRDSLVTLQAEVARNYVELRGQQLRLAIAEKEKENWQTNVEIAEARYQAGLISHLELSRALGELATAESRIPLLENALLETVHRIAILLGREPMDLVSELYEAVDLPHIADNLPAGLPSELLRRRPDVRKAERELASATARIGVSTAQLFPRFSLTGSFGYQSQHLDDLTQDSSQFWQIGPTFRWSILNLRRILSNIEASRAVREETLARYEKSVLASLEEVENALVRLSREKRRSEALGRAVEFNDVALSLATELYRAGTQSYLAVLDAESALYLAQNQLSQSRQNRALGLIALYKALGGGWEMGDGEEENPSASEAAGDGSARVEEQRR
jgi:outer membrane protein, multidrug efflux system